MILPKSPSFSLEGKRAIVAGASSGIGSGCAIALAEAGALVCLAARNTNKLKLLKKALHSRGYSSEILTMDISNVERTRKQIHDLGPFDVLVNSAGVAKHSLAVETTVIDYDQVMNTNLKGAYFLTREVARGLVKATKGGSLINISSQMGHVGGLERAVYSASKHAVEGFTKAMAMEFGKFNIRVNTICPTFVRTPLTEQSFNDPDKIEWIKSKIKLNRVGTVEDIMGAVVFLASSASAMVTGSALMIDGGWTAG